MESPMWGETHRGSAVCRCRDVLFDCDEDLYGEEARVEFYHFVRPECKFDSVEELKAQIQRDAGSGKRYFEKRGLHY